MKCKYFFSDTEDSKHELKTDDLVPAEGVEHDGEMQKSPELETESNETHEMAQEVPRESSPESIRVSSRVRKQTERGLCYEIDLYARRLKSAVSLWHKSVNESTILMTDATDANQLRVARDQVIGCINEVTNIYDHFSSLPIDESQRSLLCATRRC